MSAGREPFAIVIHPNNKYAYAVNFLSPSNKVGDPGTISQYNIAANGVLTPMTTPSVPAGAYPGWLTFDSSGQFLYAINEGDGTISEYTIGADGSLTSLGTVPAGKGGQWMATTKIGP